MPRGSKKQLEARKRLVMASKKARAEYDKLPSNMQTAARWHALVKKNYK